MEGLRRDDSMRGEVDLYDYGWLLGFSCCIGLSVEALSTAGVEAFVSSL